MRRGRWEPDDESEIDEWDRNDEDETSWECPYCGKEMYDDSPRCPSCGQYLSAEDAPPEKKPPWIMITAVILLVIMLFLAVNWF